MTLADLLEPEAEEGGRIFGVVTGVVTNASDPDGLGRVRVRFRWLSDDNDGWWARIASPMAGARSGLHWPLLAGEEVLVAFEHGDPAYPYVLGALRNVADRPVDADPQQRRQVIRSRSGHTITLDDDPAGGIEIVDASGKNSIVITSQGDGLEIQAAGDVTISAGSSLRIQAASIEIDATTAITARSAGNIAIQATGELSLAATRLNIAADVDAQISGAVIELG